MVYLIQHYQYFKFNSLNLPRTYWTYEKKKKKTVFFLQEPVFESENTQVKIKRFKNMFHENIKQKKAKRYIFILSQVKNKEWQQE